jgi:hypothetical protein
MIIVAAAVEMSLFPLIMMATQTASEMMAKFSISRRRKTRRKRMVIMTMVVVRKRDDD